MRERPISKPARRRPRIDEIVSADDGMDLLERSLAPAEAAVTAIDTDVRLAAEENARQLQLALSSVAAAREIADQAQREALQHRRSAARAWRCAFLMTVLLIGVVIGASVLVAEKEKARGIADAQIGLLQRDIDETRGSIDRRDNVKVKLAAAEGRLAEVLATLDATRDKLQSTSVDYTAAQERLDRVDHSLRKTEAERDQLRSRMISLSQELVDTKKELSRLERELAATRARIPIGAAPADDEQPADDGSTTDYFPWRDGDADDEEPDESGEPDGPPPAGSGQLG